MLINSPNISGSLRVTGNAVITGSLTVLGGINATITGSVTTASYVEYSNVANKPTLVSGSAQVSFNGITDKPTLVSGSAQVSFNGITDKPTLVSGSSQITYSGISSIPSGIVSGSAQVASLGFATTGSNTFQANQTITGSLFITQNLVVAGSSSIQYISSSVLDIADNIITVNAFNPGVRFGGLAVIDSGSSPQVSGSLLFDSIKDQWIFVHQNQTVVTSSVVLMGPETYNDLGNETYLSANRLPKGSGIEHLRDSNITDTGTVVSVNSNTAVTGSFTVVSGSAVELQVTNLGVNIGSALTDSHIISGSLRVNPNGLFVSGSGNVGINTITPSERLSVVGAGLFGSHGAGSYSLAISNNDQSNVRLRITNAGSGGQSFSIVGGNPGASNAGLAIFDETNSLTRLYVASGGNVGIGITDLGPDGLSLPTGFNYSWSEGSGNAYAVLFRQRNSAATVIANGYKRSSTAGFASSFGTSMARAAIAVGSNNGSIAFFSDSATNVANGTDIAPTERMTILNTGNVGIGTSGPVQKLHVEGSAAIGTTGTEDILLLGRALSGGVSFQQAASLKLGRYQNAGGVYESYTRLDIALRDNSAASNYNTNTTVMTLTNAGNVGIGTTDPGVRLVNSGATLASVPTLGSGTIGANAILSTNGLYGLYTGVAAEGWVWQQVQRNDSNSAVYSLVLQPSGGNVGIGTTSITNGTTFGGGGQINRLKVQSTNYTCLEINGSTSGGSVQFTYGTNSPNQVAGLLAYNYANGAANEFAISNILSGPLIFATSNTERMRIMSGGAVGTGQSSGGTPLRATLVKQGTTSVTFTATVGTIGAWRPGHAMIKVSGGQNGLQEYWAAWFYIRIIAYFASSAICTVVDSGGDTSSVSFSSTSNTSSPQTVTFTLTDGGGTTNTMIADIDLTYNEGIVSLS